NATSFVSAQLGFSDLSGAVTQAQGGLPTGGADRNVLIKTGATTYVSGWGTLVVADLADGDNLVTLGDLGTLTFADIGGQIAESQIPTSISFVDPGEGGFIFFDETAGQSLLLKTLSLTLTGDVNDYNPTNLSFVDENNPGAFTLIIDPGG